MPVAMRFVRIRFVGLVLGTLLSAGLAVNAVAAGFCNNYSDPDAQHWCRMFGNDDINSPRAPKAPAFGAIAVGPKEALGWSYNWQNRAAAEKVALDNCRSYAGPGGKCEIAIWFYDRCGAIAVGSNGRYGAEFAASTGTASRAALAGCRKSGGADCAVKRTVCSY